MKIRVTGHYEADPTEGFEDGCGFVEVTSEETHLSLDELIDRLETVEDISKVTIDHGGDDEWYDLDLPDYADSKSDATNQANMVFSNAMALIAKR